MCVTCQPCQLDTAAHLPCSETVQKIQNQERREAIIEITEYLEQIVSLIEIEPKEI